jgi:hypothetical protein
MLGYDGERAVRPLKRFANSGDAVGRHLTQTFNFAVCSHRVSALDCAPDIAKTREATP